MDLSTDPDGVDVCLGVGQYDLSSITQWSTGESPPLCVPLSSRTGEPCGELFISTRSDVKASISSRPTLSPETQAQLSFFKSLSLFHSFNEEQLIALTRRLTVRTFEPGSVIIRQGDIGEEFYIVQSGKVSGRPLPLSLLRRNYPGCLQSSFYLYGLFAVHPNRYLYQGILVGLACMCMS